MSMPFLEAFFIPLDRRYRIQGKIMCNGEYIPEFNFTIVESNTDELDVTHYTGHDGVVNVSNSVQDGLHSYIYDPRLEIPFECGTCKGEFIRNIGTEYQHDNWADVENKPYKFGGIELSYLCEDDYSNYENQDFSQPFDNLGAFRNEFEKNSE
uniref:YopX domain-containing protein n=1 Tax=Panagrellus redivivus TaxID=6233 RepID=A0A7E4VWD9_PANRE